MKQHYQQEINRQIDIVRDIDCVNFSIGANNIEDFAWIENNIDGFREKSIEFYNKIISFAMQKLQLKLYFLIYEEKDFKFTATERHLGIRHSLKNIPTFEKAKDVYLCDNIRYNYVELKGLAAEQFSILIWYVDIFIRCVKNSGLLRRMFGN